MATLTRQQRKERKRIAEETRAILVERFPRCFCAKGAPKTPLKVGISRDIREAAPDIPRRALRFALADYTSGRTYKRQLITGTVRVDLDGYPAGAVTEEQEADAKARLAKADHYPAKAGRGDSREQWLERADPATVV